MPWMSFNPGQCSDHLKKYIVISGKIILQNRYNHVICYYNTCILSTSDVFVFSRDDYDARSIGMSFEDFSRLHDNDFNSRVSCDSLPPIDLSAWRHGPYTN